MGLFDVGVGGGDLLPYLHTVVGTGEGHAGLGVFGELVAFELGEGDNDGDHCLPIAPTRSLPGGRYRCRRARSGT